MALSKHDVASSSHTLSGVIKDERDRQSIHGKQDNLLKRVRGIDCMLADIEAQIRRLRQERIHLSLVREGLTGRRSGESLHDLVS